MKYAPKNPKACFCWQGHLSLFVQNLIGAPLITRICLEGCHVGFDGVLFLYFIARCANA